MIPFNNPRRGKAPSGAMGVSDGIRDIVFRVNKQRASQLTEKERAELVEQFREAIAGINTEPEPKLSAGQFTIGKRIWFDGSKAAYVIRAQSARFVVCTAEDVPSEYTILDMAENVRGIENLVRQEPTDTERDCRAMVERLEGIHPTFGLQTEISTRSKLPFRIAHIE